MDTSTIYSQYANVTADIYKTGIQNKDMQNATDEELMDACKEFEQYLVEQMYKAMEKTVMKEEDEESSDSYISGMTEYFGDMQTQKYAQLITESGDFGIAQKLYDQLKLNVSSVIPPAEQAQADDASKQTEA